MIGWDTAVMSAHWSCSSGRWMELDPMWQMRLLVRLEIIVTGVCL
jgi:hypothetical protein